VDIIRTVHYDEINFCRFIRVMNDGPYTLL